MPKSTAEALPEAPACARCGAQDRPLSQCAKCHQRQYCSRDCQVFDWKHGHKQACLSPDDRRPTTAAPAAEVGPTVTAAASPEASEPAKTKKKSMSASDCAFCGAVDLPLKPCTRCGVPEYCSRDCQLAHWKEGHKQACVPPDQRRPEAAATASKREPATEGPECAICLSPVDEASACTLPCSHTFHGECVAGLRKFGVAQACPICRAELPPGPEKLHDEGGLEI